MKRLISIILFLTLCISISAQDVFNARIDNKEYGVYIQMNLHEESIEIPGQEILGKVYGYLRKYTDGRVWIIMSVKLSNDGNKAELEIINDYGSEDLIAELTYEKDGTYTLKQISGSTIKVAGDGKWIKLPKQMTFVNKKVKG